MPKILDSFPNYSIDEYGNVFGQKGQLKSCLDKRGYRRVWLYNHTGRKEQYIHRLVAKTYIEGSGETVNHIDGNKLNNHISNLEWLSNADNIRHSFDIGLRTNLGHKKGRCYVISRDLLDQLIELNRNGSSIRSLAKTFNVHRATLQYAINNNLIPNF